eukprot:4717476-Prymnesium_polylepis.1
MKRAEHPLVLELDARPCGRPIADLEGHESGRAVVAGEGVIEQLEQPERRVVECIGVLTEVVVKTAEGPDARQQRRFHGILVRALGI